MQQIQANIAVIGGGASGLTAAIEAKRRGGSNCHVIIIEKNAKLGKKLLATGNGRCNLGNKDEKNISHYSGSCKTIAKRLFSEYEGSEAFFRTLGVICKSDSGRLYPYSNHAASVLDALQLQVQKLHIDVLTDAAVTAIVHYGKKWKITTGSREVLADEVIIATGGKAAPVMGTDGSFYRIVKSLGHTWQPFSPALCPVSTQPELLQGLKGIRIYAKVSLYDKYNKLIASDIGEVQLTDKTVSGICVFNLTAYARDDNMTISIDLIPDLSMRETIDLLWDIFGQRSQYSIEDMLTGLFRKNLCHVLFKASGIDKAMDSPVYTIAPNEIEVLANTIKNWRFPVLGLSDWNNAQTTAGGIPAHELTDNLESNLHKGLYFAGEILDIVGECGGYNLAWAWNSGIYAARKAIESLKG